MTTPSTASATGIASAVVNPAASGSTTSGPTACRNTFTPPAPAPGGASPRPCTAPTKPAASPSITHEDATQLLATLLAYRLMAIRGRRRGDLTRTEHDQVIADIDASEAVIDRLRYAAEDAA